MDYPHDRHSRHHHGRDRREEEEDYPPPSHQPPPPFYGGDDPPPPFHGGNDPPPHFYSTNDPPPPFHGRNDPSPPFHGGNDPPPPFYGGNEFPPPSQVHHSSHTGSGHDSYPSPPPAAAENPHHRPHMPHSPATGDHSSHRKEDEFTQKPSVRMYCKAESNYSLTIRDGKVILARSDPSDPCQHWIKDEKWGIRVKDEEGFPSFALINKATGEALKHSTGASHPVQLITYNPNVPDESVLWSESKDLGDGHRAIRMVNNIRLNVDAWNGDKNHGGVHDGTTIALWEWKKGDNQRWKIVRY